MSKQESSRGYGLMILFVIVIVGLILSLPVMLMMNSRGQMSKFNQDAKKRFEVTGKKTFGIQ